MDKSKAEQALPMFYRSPRPLDRRRDAALKASRPSHFRFATGTNAVPLLIDEFPMASAYYPIVFAAGPLPIPAAVVGLRNDQNLFIDADGRWLAGSYLPAYVRRYPFLLMDDPEAQQFVLCIDEASDILGEDGDYPLFDGDEPSAFTRSAMEFCAALRQQGDATDELVKALREHDLLMENNAQIDLPDNRRLQLSEFLVIDPTKFDALPESVFLEWRAKGWIGLVYAQLLSSHRWQNLANLAMLGNRRGLAQNPALTGDQQNIRRSQVTEEFRLLRRPTRADKTRVPA